MGSLPTSEPTQHRPTAILDQGEDGPDLPFGKFGFAATRLPVSGRPRMLTGPTFGKAKSTRL